MAFGDDVVVGDIVHVREGAPDLAGRVRIERHLVTRVWPGRPGFLVPPDPAPARVRGAGHADVGVGDVVAVLLEGVDVVVPRAGDDETGANPGGAGPGRLAGSRIRMAAEPGGAPIIGDVALGAHEDDAIGIAGADGGPEWRFAAVRGLAGGRALPVRGDIVACEPRVLEVGIPPGLAAIIAAKDRAVVRRMKSGAGVHHVDGEGLGVRAEDLAILGDRPVGIPIRSPGVQVEALPHGRFPGLALIPRAIDPSLEFAVLLPASHRAVQDRDLTGAIGAPGETLDFRPRQPPCLVRPRLAPIIGAPDASFRRGVHHAARSRAIEMEGDQPSSRARAGRPGDARVPR